MRKMKSAPIVGFASPQQEKLFHKYLKEGTEELWIPSTSKKPDTPAPKDSIFSPVTFDDYIGQPQAKRLANIMVQAAHNERRALPNIMLVGEYGLGKTSLAKIIMRAAGLPEHMHDGVSINKAFPTESTFIIDEIHNLESSTADSLNLHLDSGKYHIIGCTNNPGALPSAFRSRFRTIQLTSYQPSELKTIARRVCKRKGINFSESALELLSLRSRFNARQVIMYLSMAFDLMSVSHHSTLSVGVVHETFEFIGVDSRGLLPRDREYLKALPPHRAVGLQYLSAVLGIDDKTIEEEVEPFLLRMGFIDRTPRGRIKIEG